MVWGRKIGVCACILLAGCTAHKTPLATGGSRSDGTVDISYEYGVFEKPVFDTIAVQTQARERCAAWGYTDAQMFGGQKQECIARDGYGTCVQTRATMTFQCTSATPPPAPVQ